MDEHLEHGGDGYSSVVYEFNSFDAVRSCRGIQTMKTSVTDGGVSTYVYSARASPHLIARTRDVFVQVCGSKLKGPRLKT